MAKYLLVSLLKQLIYLNKKIPTITKLQYLRSLLTDSAQKLIALIEFTSKGYGVAIKMLRRE
jgi:Protein of unknown function (DUF1759)